MFREVDFSSQQRKLISSRDRRVLVDAGAGSGKTRTLIGRIVSLLEDPACWGPSGRPSLHRIVAITFTEKAALEMKTRLRREFRDRARAPEIRNIRVDWAELEREVENARISTIHSFCSGLLRQHALLLGINPDMRVLDATETELLFTEFLEEALSRAFDDRDPDARALCTEFGVARVARMLRELMAQRIRVTGLLDDLADGMSDAERFAAFLRDIRPLRLRLITQVQRSRRFRCHVRGLQEILSLIDGPMGVPDVIRAKVQCVQQFFDTVQRQPEQLPEFLSGYPDRWKRAGQFNTRELGDYITLKPVLNKLNEYVKEFLFLQNADGETEPWISEAAGLTVSLGRVFRRISADWQTLKVSRNTLDFDDLIVAVRDCLRTTSSFRELVRRDIRFLLVDEQQDTDPVQMEIFDLLCAGNGGPDLFMVGDANQSIYRFRGADVSVFVRQKERPGTATSPLLENYRCQASVLRFINTFFEKTGMLQQHGPYRPLDVKRPSLLGFPVEVYLTARTDQDRPLTTQERAGKEAEFIALRILQWISSGDVGAGAAAAVSGGTPQFGDFAILLRQGTHAEIFEEALRRRGIPATVHVGATFYRQQEVFDCAALARLALNRWDEAALVQVLRSPFVGLCDDDLVRLRMAALENEQTLSEYFHTDQTPGRMEHPDRLAWGRHLYCALSSLRHLDAGAFFRMLFARTEAETLALGLPHGFQIRANLRKMARVAESYGGSGLTGLRAFVEGLDQFIRAGADEGEANLHGGQVNAVRILSIHKAKGLEFPVVFLPQTGVRSNVAGNTLLWHADIGLVLAPSAQPFDREAFPFQRILKVWGQLDDQAEMERLLYVAMTRARDRLVLCVPEEQKSNTWAEPLSEFLDLAGRRDGEIIQGEGWQVRIWRSMPVIGAKTETGTGAAGVFPAGQSPPSQPPAGEQNKPAGQEAGIRVISVTRLLNLMGTREQDEDEDRPEEIGPAAVRDEIMLSPDRRQAVRRGTLVHRFFELWRDFAGPPPNPDRLFRELRVAPSCRDALRHSLEGIVRLFTMSPLWERLARDRNAKREYPFYYRLDRVVVRGTLDWLGSDGLILDYKTGHITAEKLERYRTQLGLYAATVRQVLGWTQLEGVLYFTDTGQVEWVDLSEAMVVEVTARAREWLARHEASPAD